MKAVCRIYTKVFLNRLNTLICFACLSSFRADFRAVHTAIKRMLMMVQDAFVDNSAAIKVKVDAEVPLNLHRFLGIFNPFRLVKLKLIFSLDTP